MRQRIMTPLAAALLLLSSAAMAQAPEKMGSKEKRLGGSLRGAWNDRAAAIEGQLREGDCKRAERGAESLLRDIVKVLSGGEGAGPILAGPLRLRALAEACQGNERLALWDLDSAQLLAPAVFVPVARLYGEAGPRLAEAIALRTQKKTPPESQHQAENPAVGDGRQIDPPEPLNRHELEFPSSLSKAMKTGSFPLLMIIGKDGYLSEPRFPQDPPQNAVFLFAALDTLRDWRFRPARLDGQPVAVYYNLMVNFRR